MRQLKANLYFRLIIVLVVLIATIITTVSIVSTKPKSTSPGSENMATIESLNSESRDLKDKIDRWNAWNVAFLVGTFFAAGGLVVAGFVLNGKNKKLIGIQDELSELNSQKIATANALAGTANRRAEELTQENLKLKGAIDRSTAETLLREEQLKAKNLETESKLEDEKSARLKIEEAVAWRRLSKDQQSEIGTRLRPFAGQLAALSYNVNDLEASAFGLDLASALQSAHWTVSEPQPILKMAEGPVPLGTNPPLETGVVIVSTGDAASRNASDALVYELTTRGFDARKRPQNESRPHSVVFISIEHRPERAQGEAKLRMLNSPK